MDSEIPSEPVPAPPIINYIFGFCLVGIAWGFTTPFIRAAARTHKPPAHPILESEAVKKSWLKSKLFGAFFGVVDLLRNPRYAIPLVINLTGSIWFFLLIGQAGESTPILLAREMLAGFQMLISYRIVFDRSHYKFAGVSVHGSWRLVG
jgi:hypothetical protein